MTPPRTHLVTLLCSGGPRTFAVREGGSLLRAALRARLPVARSCRGDAVCAACRVTIVDGAEQLAGPTAAESALLLRHPLPPGERYACQARVYGPVTITTPYW